MLALLLLAQATAADVVVNGKRLAEAQAACVRGTCTPLRDAQASIALAEAQFREGRYLDARRLLAAAVARNRIHAATDPKPVAALYEAYATVALHEGDQDIYKRAVVGEVRTLRDNLPAGDPAVVAATPALGDMWIKLGNYRQALSTYQAAERDAIEGGQDGAALVAALRRVSLVAAAGQSARAARMLDAIEARPAARDPAMRVVLRIVRFRIAARDADDAEMTELARAVGRSQPTRPALIWSPPFPTDATAAANAEARRFGQPDAIRVQSNDLAPVQWIDVGFWIRPDGRTAEAEILRASRSPGWASAMLAQIEGRRYAALPGGAADVAAAGGGVYRVERITRRANYLTPVDSLIRRRVPADGFETLDLTESNDSG